MAIRELSKSLNCTRKPQLSKSPLRPTISETEPTSGNRAENDVIIAHVANEPQEHITGFSVSRGPNKTSPIRDDYWGGGRDFAIFLKDPPQNKFELWRIVTPLPLPAGTLSTSNWNSHI